ncbi:MAG: hypothetical protein KDE04_07880 [Anaerolineales bacterium]|nr:hypothetical protein [Anaerolineales bacterium]
MLSVDAKGIGVAVKVGAMEGEGNGAGLGVADRPVAVRHYKKHPDAPAHIATLWAGWAERFAIQGAAPTSDGGLDALVCATLAFLYHQQPESLLHLRHPAAHKSGFGPFYVLRPDLL